MLKTVVWPRIKNVAGRRRYWFQQDGATPHTAVRVREWLTSKFGDRVISRFTDRPWPARSPDLSPLDYWFWSVCMVELRKNPPNSLPDLVNTVGGYAASLNYDQISAAVKDVLPRANACIEADGGAFEYKLKGIKRRL